MRLARLTVLSLVVFLLAGCGLVFLTPFPSFLSELERERDLTGLVSSDSLGDYELTYIGRSDADGSLIALYVSTPANGRRVFFFDESLNLVGEAFDDPADPNDDLRSTAIYDPTGYIYMGDQALEIANDFADAGGIDIASNQGYYDSGTGIGGDQVITVERVTTPLNASGYSGPGDLGTPLGTPPSIDSSGTVDRVASVYHDFAAGQVAMVFGQSLAAVPGTQRFFVIVRSDTNTVTSLPDPIFGPGGLTPIDITVDDFDGSIAGLHYTRRGMVARLRDEFYAAYATDGSLIAVSPERLFTDAITFSYSGETFYTFDSETLLLRKVGTWW